MKTLIWVGAPAGVYGRQHWRDLLRVWVDDRARVHVEPLAPEFAEVADAVQEEIDRRISDPRGILFWRMTGKSWLKTDKGKVISHGSVSRQQTAVPWDDNFLEVLRSDPRFAHSNRSFAGYVFRDGASRIIEE